MGARLLLVLCMSFASIAARREHIERSHTRLRERSRLCVNMLAVHRSNQDGEVDRACNRSLSEIHK